jgi:hypothetical protein
MVRPHGAALWQGRRLAAVIPSGFSRLPAAGAWGGPRRAAGSIRGTAAPPGGVVRRRHDCEATVESVCRRLILLELTHGPEAWTRSFG